VPVVVPFAENVFTWPADQPQLIGGQCGDCAAVFFPAQPSCGRCGSTAMAEHLLPTSGTVYSWTSQEFLPPPPYTGGETRDSFRPTGVGLIDLEGEIMVEARLTECSPDKVHIGQRVEMVIVPFRSDPEQDVVMFAFKPV
jgi:uncharacterized protein